MPHQAEGTAKLRIGDLTRPPRSIYVAEVVVPKVVRRGQAGAWFRFLCLSILFYVLLGTVALHWIVPEEPSTVPEITVVFQEEDSQAYPTVFRLPTLPPLRDPFIRRSSPIPALTSPVPDIGEAEISPPDAQPNFAKMLGEVSFAPPRGKEKQVEFFGVKSSSRDLVIVLDVSGSMIMRPRSSETYRRLESEVIATLEQLPSYARFNVVAFSAFAESFAEMLVPASEERITGAIKWVRKYSPNRLVKSGQIGDMVDWVSVAKGRHDGTRADLALKKALSAGAENILYVSDGEPTNFTSQEVLGMVQREQAGRKWQAVIHTISYQSDAGKAFLKELAAKNGGTFRVIE